MNAATQQEENALTLPQRAAVALGESANIAKLRELAAQSANILDVTNADGRKEAHRAGMVLRETRTKITNTGKSAREDAVAFGKAVIALEKDLIAIIQPEEDRVLALRDKFDEEEAAKKAAKIAAERARVEAIQKAVQALRDMPLKAVGKTSAEISALIGGMVGAEPDESFEEFLDEAKQARLEALEKLAAAEAVQRGVEIEAEARRQAEARAAADAEDRRLAEVARLEAERAENARVSAENARAAAQVAAERQALADASAKAQAAADALRKEAEDKAQAARDEQAKAAAAQQAAFDKQAADIAAASRKLAEQQAAADARDAEARAQLAREAAHGEALMMNAEFDVARDARIAQEAADDAERVRLQALAEKAEADALAPAPTLDALMDQGDDTEAPLTDSEIIDLVAESFALSRVDAIDRLQAIDFGAAREVAA